MEKQSENKNEMQEYLTKKGKSTTKNDHRSGGLSKLRGKAVVLFSKFKKMFYNLMKVSIFMFFVYHVEYRFSRLRYNIGRQGGFQKQGMGGGM